MLIQSKKQFSEELAKLKAKKSGAEVAKEEGPEVGRRKEGCRK
jgi:hypothetical protein